MFRLPNRIIGTAAILFLVINQSSAQTNEGDTLITGRIQNAKGEAVRGAFIKDLSSKSATTSDDKGNFILKAKKSDTQFEVSRVGYQHRIVSLGALSLVSLLESESSLDDVVVVGYNTQSRRKLTSAVSTLKGDAIKDIPAVSFDQMLQGRVAGVNVQLNSGEPGAKTNVIIRGSTNVDYGNENGGNTQPLYVIDGVIYDVNNLSGSYSLSNPLSVIDPNDILSIEVLKDASAAAIYGARGGNGVIIVKTRRAESLRPIITFSAYGGVTTRPRLINVITGAQERALKLALLNSQLPYTDIANGNIPIQLTDSLNSVFNGDLDWQGMMLRKNTYVNNEQLSMEGRLGGNNSYRFAISHYNEQGAIKGYGVERIAPSLDLMLNPIPKFQVKLSMQMSSESRHHGANISGSPYLFSTWSFPTSLVNLSKKMTDMYSGNSNRFDDNTIFSMNGSLSLTDTIAKGLTVTSNLGIVKFNDKYAYFSPVELNGVQNTAYDISNENPNWTWETYAQYNKKFGVNNLTLVGGFSAYHAQQYNTTSSASGINVSGIYTVQTVPPGSNLLASSSVATKNTQSYYGRAMYDYKGKYLFTASLRRDASSIYSPDYRWGTFYALSAGWVVSDEKFFEPLKNAIGMLKFRGSYGVTGMDPGTWYAKYQQLYADASFLGATTGAIGGSAAYPYLTGTPSTYNGTTVVTPFPYANNYVSNSYKSSNSVRWEKYPQWDWGMDLDMFDSRISLQVDWYQKDAKDKYLWAIPATSTSGYGYYSGNYADIRNTGWEFTLNTQNLSPKSKLQWSTNFNISFNHGWITKLPNGNKDIEFGDSWFRKTLTRGEPLFGYKSYQINGVYATDADVPTDPITGNKMTYFGTPFQAGDRRMVDQNGDYNINYDDQVPTGKSPMPTTTGGITNTFTYKGFSLSVFAVFSYGNYLINGTLSDALNGSSSYSTWGTVAGPAGIYSNILNQFWMQNGDQTTYPKLVYPQGNGTDPWNVNNSYFLQKGGYFKINQVTLGYNLPRTLKGKWHIKGINVYGMAWNIHTFKQSKALVDPTLYDMTTGSSNATYPSALKYTFGFRIQL